MPGVEDVIRNLQAVGTQRRQMLEQLAGKRASMMEADAKQNAYHGYWNKQTGNAVQGLRGQVVTDGDTVKVVIAHSVEYGKYLELGTARSRPRSLLQDTRDEHVEPFFDEVKKVVEG